MQAPTRLMQLKAATLGALVCLQICKNGVCARLQKIVLPFHWHTSGEDGGWFLSTH